MLNNSPHPHPKPEYRAVYELMWKYGRVEQAATDDNIIRRMRIACWMKNVTDTHSEYVISLRLAFYSSSGYLSVPDCYVTLTLTVLLSFELFRAMVSNGREKKFCFCWETYCGHTACIQPSQ